MSRSILSGITDRQYRSTVQDLVSQGWSPRKTGGGHIKLMHPEAREPVFASCTPSCSRSSENLKAQARRALVKPCETDMSSAFTVSLKGTSSAVALGQATAGFAEQQRDAHSGSKKRKDRWDERRRQEAAAGKPVSAAPEPVDPKPADLKPAAAKDAKPAPSVPAPAVKPATASLPAEPLPAPVVALAAVPASSGAPAVVGADAPATPAQPARKRLRRPTAPAKATAAKPVMAQTAPAIHSPVEIDGALLDLALRIRNGEMQGLLITPEMVGKTLWFSGDSALTGPSAAAAAPVSAVTDVATSRQEGWDAKRQVDEALLMRGIDGSYRALPDILSRALAADAAHVTESRKTVLRRRLKVMALEGRLDAVEGAKQGMTYRSVPV